MAKKTEAEVPQGERTIEQRRAAITATLGGLARSGIRLSPDKQWLKPAIEGAIDAKLAALDPTIPDDHLASVEAVLKAITG